MKYVLLLLLASFSLYAETLGRIPNKMGGEIIISDVHCKGFEKDPVRRVAYIKAADGQVLLFGCTSGIEDNQVIIKWNDGYLFMYSLDQMIQ